MTTITMTIIATIGAVAILFLTGIVLGLAGYEDKKTREYRQKVDAILSYLSQSTNTTENEGEHTDEHIH